MPKLEPIKGALLVEITRGLGDQAFRDRSSIAEGVLLAMQEFKRDRRLEFGEQARQPRPSNVEHKLRQVRRWAGRGNRTRVSRVLSGKGRTTDQVISELKRAAKRLGHVLEVDDLVGLEKIAIEACALAMRSHDGKVQTSIEEREYQKQMIRDSRESFADQKPRFGKPRIATPNDRKVRRGERNAALNQLLARLSAAASPRGRRGVSENGPSVKFVERILDYYADQLPAPMGSDLRLTRSQIANRLKELRRRRGAHV